MTVLVEVKIDDIYWRVPFSFFKKNLAAGSELIKRYSDYPVDSDGERYCELDETPHFKALNGDDSGFIEYLKIFVGFYPWLKEEKNRKEALKDFKKLAMDFDYLSLIVRPVDLERGNECNYIRVARLKSQKDKYYIEDGDHRLAIMKHRKDETVLCNVN